MSVQHGKLWGVGLGPGDPELVTVKAARVIGEADVVAFHSARHGRSISRGVAAAYMRDGQIEEHLVYPVTTEATDHPGGYQGAIDEFYEESADRLAAHLSAGRSVVLLAEGDPLFYSSYMHMHKRLCDRFDVEVVPGVTSVSAASAALATPLVERDEVFTVLPGTLPVEELTRRLRTTDAAAIMKLGRTYPNVVRALRESGRLDEAKYVERASTPAQRVLAAAEVDPSEVPYFSIAIVPSPVNNPVAARGASTTGEVVVVGLGPGADRWTTDEVRRELAAATDLVGYVTYVDRVPVRPGQTRHISDNKVESERAAFALDLAKRGKRVAVVSSGDPGVFAMASAVVEVAAEPQWSGVPVRVVPGMTAANAVASRVGAPLGHDYAVISLSDRLKPWDVVAQRLSAVAAADMAIAIYNPASKSRTWQVAAMRDLLLEHRGPDTPVIIGRAVGSDDETVRTVRLADLDPADVDMRCLLIIGSSQTTVVETGSGTQIFTPRRYPEVAANPS
ncbi:precorrin-3B C(17)-methyltransferase [Rhodococcus sp. BP-252]|uniref:precorrin-3B C(17)-methyltransferase n=1 Tax=unclassified Rhodococcus (in: high G+C Gram-positive bacteria) TaxID=192944 RepID=UPI001C9A7760|nr:MULTISPECIES: precorrin-3B C(17)-methyltransferase [unclassified Rhodococcus (in: high G+C Gram-positive bacteria)]MBY6410084.1 precorrin-3B C(17)-methyltransferase [Rhodococcus sp. BP-320]MBY6415053.1 precorrin-3B C(17)-methyltransferase [Rhodococcus sp. BP-321]MBY6421244.1 precorrin-3B C(17)-methyltransferase [Rhodococcus sp. BP-324]MBY6425639.1 precorrin-3B C(17)-methyltransferase [Rhodococcus sp. BP-323]MBY6429949.1 precorrin-3B C(17)-methyltransferase [Rhodococcus sp. BP-322]